MDDFLILSNNKKHLWIIKADIEAFLQSHLSLHLNNKTTIFPVSAGVSFVGYRVWKSYRLLSPISIKRTRKRLKIYEKLYRKRKIKLIKIKSSIKSWLAHAKWTNSRNLINKILSHKIFGKYV